MTKIIPLDFEVDKLTNSIVNTLTGETFETDILPLKKDDVLGKIEWLFDWEQELEEGREVYKLVTSQNPSLIHGLISFEDRKDHLFIDLFESASFNKGRAKLFDGVPANLVAFVCKTSFERGYRGYSAFVAKTRLVEHYEKSLGSKRLYGHHMLIETDAAIRLIQSYYKDFDVTRY
jgi:hypothetical protein